MLAPKRLGLCTEFIVTRRVPDRAIYAGIRLHSSPPAAASALAETVEMAAGRLRHLLSFHAMNAVEISNVTKTFASVTAVDDLSFTAPQGSIYGFIGPNGSGKTTTMRMLVNIFYPKPTPTKPARGPALMPACLTTPTPAASTSCAVG